MSYGVEPYMLFGFVCPECAIENIVPADHLQEDEVCWKCHSAIVIDKSEVQRLEAENNSLREEAESFAIALGYGDPEIPATLQELLEPIQQAFSYATDYEQCASWCGYCGERLADTVCGRCNGSGCLPNAALAYLECVDCAGSGKLHLGCTGKTYRELAIEVQELQHTIASKNIQRTS